MYNKTKHFFSFPSQDSDYSYRFYYWEYSGSFCSLDLFLGLTAKEMSWCIFSAFSASSATCISELLFLTKITQAFIADVFHSDWRQVKTTNCQKGALPVQSSKESTVLKHSSMASKSPPKLNCWTNAIDIKYVFIRLHHRHKLKNLTFI